MREWVKEVFMQLSDLADYVENNISYDMTEENLLYKIQNARDYAQNIIEDDDED